MSRTISRTKKLAAPPAFDLASRRPVSVVVEIMDPLDATVSTGITITLAGRETPEARAARFAIADAARGRSDRDGESAAEMDAVLRDLLAACTVSWENVEEDGAPLACTPTEASRLYVAYPWLRDQVQAKYLETTAFFGGTRTR